MENQHRSGGSSIGSVSANNGGTDAATAMTLIPDDVGRERASNRKSKSRTGMQHRICPTVDLIMTKLRFIKDKDQLIRVGVKIARGCGIIDPEQKVRFAYMHGKFIRERFRSKRTNGTASARRNFHGEN